MFIRWVMDYIKMWDTRNPEFFLAVGRCIVLGVVTFVLGAVIGQQIGGETGEHISRFMFLLSGIIFLIPATVMLILWVWEIIKEINRTK